VFRIRIIRIKHCIISCVLIFINRQPLLLYFDYAQSYIMPNECEEMQRYNLTTCSIIDKIELPVESNIADLLISSVTNTPLLKVSATDIIVVNGNRCVTETGGQPRRRGIRNTVQTIEELAAKEVITPGSLDSSAVVVGRMVEPYPVDLPRTAFHFLHMRMAAQLQTGSRTDSTLSIPTVSVKDHLPRPVEVDHECVPQRRIERREWDILVQKPRRGVWKRIRNHVEHWFRTFCCCGYGKRRK